MNDDGVDDKEAMDRSRVFIVDDVSDDISIITEILEGNGFDAVACEDSETALNSAIETRPRLIILCADISRGFNLCHRMKKDDDLKDIPLILVTAKTGQDVIRKHKMLPTRADAYLVKPIDGDILTGTIEELLSRDLETEHQEEVEIGDLPDRTLVNGGLESAVVSYVEEEVAGLKEMVGRLESEKGNLAMMVKSLESRLVDDRKRLDSGLKVLDEKSKPDGDGPDESTEDIVKTAWEQGFGKGRQEASGEIDELKTRLETAADEASKVTVRDDDLKTELSETTMMFERLEAGYKESLATAGARLESAEEAQTEAEDQVESLREQVAEMEASLEDLPKLREMAARAEILEEDCERLNEELESARSDTASAKAQDERMEELEETNKGLGEKVSGLEKTNGELQAAYGELQQAVAELQNGKKEIESTNEELETRLKSMTEKVGSMEESRSTAEQTAEFARAEVSEMRDKFNKLKSIIGDAKAQSGEDEGSSPDFLEDSIELADDPE